MYTFFTATYFKHTALHNRCFWVLSQIPELKNLGPPPPLPNRLANNEAGWHKPPIRKLYLTRPLVTCPAIKFRGSCVTFLGLRRFTRIRIKPRPQVLQWLAFFPSPRLGFSHWSRETYLSINGGAIVLVSIARKMASQNLVWVEEDEVVSGAQVIAESLKTQVRVLGDSRVWLHPEQGNGKDHFEVPRGAELWNQFQEAGKAIRKIAGPLLDSSPARTKLLVREI